MADIRPGLAAADDLKTKFVAGVENDELTLEQLKQECFVLLNVIQQCLDDFHATDPNQVNWLKYSGIVYDLSGYLPADRENFKNMQKLAYQEDLDNSASVGYRVVKFDLVEQNPGTGDGKYTPVLFLYPMAKDPGGGRQWNYGSNSSYTLMPTQSLQLA